MTKKFTFSLFVCFLFFLGHNVLAVPAAPWPSEITLPDGSKITIYLRGDEKVKWMESLDGYTLMYNAEKHIVYAELDANNNMVPSNSKYSAVSVAPSGVTKGIRYSSSQVSMLKQIWDISQLHSNPVSNQLRSATAGVTHIMCALVKFSDLSFTYSQTDFQNLMNQAGYSAYGGKGSVRDFYLENSYGQLDLVVTVSGIHQLSRGWEYYGENNPATKRDYPERVQEFAVEAAEFAFGDSNINPADYDNNGDGYIDAFHIIFAGYGEEVAGSDPNRIWSHAYGFPTLTFGSKKLYRYSCSPELQGNGKSNPGVMTNVGVICHEMGHVFGAPDYYDTDYDESGGEYYGTGEWDVMAHGSWNRGGTQPPHFNIYQKKLFGWLTPVELTSYTAISGMPASASAPVAYFVKVNSNDEQYIVENRQQIGFDESVPGHGLLVWHVHPGALTGNVNNRSHPQQFYPVVASSTVQIPTAVVSSYGNVNSAGTPFPGTSGKTAFTASTTPAMFTWTNTQPVAKPLTSISENTTNKTVSFKFMDGPVDPVTNLQWSESDGDVTLTWDAPANPNVTGYKIFRNGILIYTIINPATLQYVHMNVSNGVYTYGVSATYEATESITETVMVTVSGGSEADCLPISSLKADAGANTVNLTWNAPFTGGWMGISGGYDNAWRLGGEWDSFQGTLWTPADLIGMDGYSITKVKFIPYESGPGVTYAIAIYEVANDGSDPVLAYSSAPISSLSYGEAYNEIDIPAFAIDASKGLIVGTQVHTMGGFYLTVDNGNSYPGRNIFYDEDGWDTLEGLGIPLGQNYCLGAYLESPTGGSPVILKPGGRVLASEEPVSMGNIQRISLAEGDFVKAKSPIFNASSFLRSAASGKKQFTSAGANAGSGLAKAPAKITKYLIYRDGIKIGETTDANYKDTGLTQETVYSYCVIVEYDSGCTSESVCVETKTINPNLPVQNLQAKAGFSNVTLTWEKPTNANPDSYKVFRDGTEIAEVTETFYSDNAVTNSSKYNYCIKAVYDTYDNGTIVYSMGFEASEDKSNISTLNANNDDFSWVITDAANIGATAHSGSRVAADFSWYEEAISPNDWLIFGDIILPAGTCALDYYVAAADPVWNAEHYGVYVSTADPLENTGQFVLLYEETLNATTADWTKHSIDLTAYAGQTVTLAFRHFGCRDQFALMLDDISVYGREHLETNFSDPVCLNVETLNPYQPAENLEASLDINKVTLNWDAPPVIDGSLTYVTNASNPESLPGVTAAMITQVIRFEPIDLKPLDGFNITKLRFHPGNTSDDYTYVVQIMSLEGNILTLEHEQPATITNNVWNEITLTSPVSIDVDKNLWIGVKITRKAGNGSFILPLFRNGVAGKSNYYSSNGTNWGEITLSETPVTWPIIAILEPGDAIPSVNGYQISRNDEDIDTVGAGVLTYEDILSATGSYTYCVTALYTDDNESEAVCAAAIDVRFPELICWQGDEGDSDWDNELNWLPALVPESQDIVYIPGEGVDFFPDLRDIDRTVQVTEIHFDPGAQIGGQSNLRANAFVSIDLSSSKRDRWNMLSIPLGQVFPGDFVFGGYPLSWVRKFTAAPSESLTKGGWKTISGPESEAFSYGDGFVLRLDADGGEKDDPLRGLKQLKGGILELPYFQNFQTGIWNYDFYNSVNLAHDYEHGGISPVRGTSTFYDFNFIDQTVGYQRGGNSYEKERLEAAFKLLESDFSKTVEFEDGFALIGNPYMATLDFKALFDANPDAIGPSYQVWTDDGKGVSGYGVYTVFGHAGHEESTLDEFIAPLQGFIVSQSEGLNTSISFDEEMTSVGSGSGLRSSFDAGNKLDIVARNPVAGVRTFIAKREGGHETLGVLDARKIINNISEVPEIYTLKPKKNGSIAVAANIINNDNLLIPIGLATSYTGDITLTFSGMDTYDAKLNLIDIAADRTIDLTGLASYDYTVEYSPKILNGDAVSCENRFFIRISKSPTGLNGTIAEKVNVFESNGFVRIISGASTPLKEVAVYDLQGALIYKVNGINTVSHTVERSLPAGVYVVKVGTEKDVEFVKFVK